MVENKVSHGKIEKSEVHQEVVIMTKIILVIDHNVEEEEDSTNQ